MHTTGKLWIRGMRLSALALMLGMVTVTGLSVGASQLYTDPNGAFQFVVPDDWQQQQPTDSSTVAEFSSVDGNAILFLDDDTIPTGTSSLAYYKAATSTLSSNTGYHLNGTSNVMANGAYQPAIDYTVMNRSGLTIRVRQAFIASGTDGWTLTVAAEDSVAYRYMTTFTNAVQSFTVASTTTSPPMQPTTVQPAVMQPAAQAAAGGLPVGHYACLTSYSGTFAGGLTISSNSAYMVDDTTGVGMYRFDPTTGQITFASGPYAGGLYGVYDTSGYPTIHVYTPGSRSSVDCQPGR